jgi:hypothetical protein
LRARLCRQFRGRPGRSHLGLRALLSLSPTQFISTKKDYVYPHIRVSPPLDGDSFATVGFRLPSLQSRRQSRSDRSRGDPRIAAWSWHFLVGWEVARVSQEHPIESFSGQGINMATKALSSKGASDLEALMSESGLQEDDLDDVVVE